jgi:hypothetical protein
MGNSPNFDDPGINGLFEIRSTSETPNATGVRPFDGFGPLLSLKTPDNIAMLQLVGHCGHALKWRAKQASEVTLANEAWRDLLDSSNYTNYTVTKTGTGASGTWGIDVTGSATSLTGAGLLTWSGDHVLSSSNRPRIKLHFGQDQLFIFDSNNSAYHSILTSENYPTYTVQKNGTGASGTWGISITGSANFAHNDGDGNGITSSYLRRYDWWNLGDSHNADDLRGGMTFAYNVHNAPTTGTIVSFDCRYQGEYSLQIMGSYSYNGLYFRNRNGDNGTWNTWRTILDDANYTSYTVQKDGVGAYGTWGINVTGSASTITGVLGLGNGGTGATTPSGARANLGICGAITHGTGDPSGGSDGDIYFKHT